MPSWSEQLEKNNSLFSLHLAVLLFGLAGLFSKFLPIAASTIVWGRTTLAVIAIGVYLSLQRERLKLRATSDVLLLGAQGVVLAVHWFTFFHSIQISSVAVGLLSFSTFPIFVLLLEYFFFRQPFKILDVIGIAIIMAGLSLIVPEFDLNNQAVRGILWGILSAVTFAVLTLLNRSLSGNYPPVHIALFQNFVAAVILTPFAMKEVGILTARDWTLLIILGVFCTALAHSLFIYSLTKIRAFVASIVASLEPVYGILAAFILLGEVPLAKEMIGGALILGATLLISLKDKGSKTA